MEHTLGVAVIDQNPEHLNLMMQILGQELITKRGFSNADNYMNDNLTYGTLMVDPATLRPDELGRLQSHLGQMHNRPNLIITSADPDNLKSGYLTGLYGTGEYEVLEKPYQMETVLARLQVLKAGFMGVADQAIAAA